ncbi:DNA polymerase III subunit gamma/tau [Roseinatronobacter bogoriensis]|uniref:DNA polymerase III subunit gamma/tau n=1 Tax=Roseinatronobacter bogoriensis subsp. barguzinensis TaxID=441209 RepID=A0A2K8KGF6_9RHOB|nr:MULTISPECIES: DNA polymerase III subunit gamma/tau [Rhodobaca]ATX65250.1 DNA polymerase III subunit gamma/tau [Rhodobaca barguzinensis]MBB4209357.1 DNA polymerase-3 subunit gamma/tau [Rhodobaca bogoriensis DSM 18756]TDW34581.1 DNA polymerase-3 subunit gamma/tau [Rhodobaca barguzinensis]TDY67099.1 DNA polymerase-3 subunit gamma/tau [Rhodobaca bogoriensis DSM 18756]
MSETQTPYQVLARKYRPESFADLIGQDAMVRTLRNAFAADRIHHAFIMTGIRGTGKTTTARIIAKGLNCIGADGQGGPTTEPCGVCEHCRAITDGRHVDVLEMDAASRTGVDDIREIIASVAYRAASARYKIYIIDEVHMLSNNAFNALLKTLEEPPAHVKFIFATTEIRKVPVTVLSRCQRFDLRRIEPEVMISHLERVAQAEGGQVAADALALITRAAEGSVRDAMSLLDQAISHGAGETSADQVRAMLGLADRARVLDLFDHIMRGDAGAALAELAAQYADGADPMAVLRDLAEITHWLSVSKITPDAGDDPTLSPEERDRGAGMAQALPMRTLTRTWQMLLKALEEVASAPNAMMAAEMVIIRLTHVADLPSPEELVRKWHDQSPPPPGTGPGTGPGRGVDGAPRAPTPAGSGSVVHRSGGGRGNGAQAALAQPVSALAHYPDFDSVVAMIREKRDMALLMEVETCLRLVKYSPGRIEFEPTEQASPDMAARLAGRLQGWTGMRWGVSVTSTGGGATLAETRAAELGEKEDAALQNELVAAVFQCFPSAKIAEIRELKDAEDAAAAEALPEVEEAFDPDWDPFEET